MTLHYIDSGWQLQMLSLGSSHFPGSHTGAEIAAKVQQQLHKYGKPDSFSPSYTTDCGANVRNAIETRLECDWIPCQAHTVHLAVVHALEALPEDMCNLLRDCSAIASHFRASPLQSDRFRAV